MKNLFYLLFFAGFGIKAQEVSFKKNGEIILRKDTVRFDEIIHYKMNKSFSGDNLRFKKHLSARKKIIYGIVKADVPRTVSDTLFVKDLEKLNFHKERLEIAQYPKIAEIYSRGSGNYETACVKTFRDILVFKKNNKIVGISKICFDCGWESTFFNEKRFNNLIDITYFEELENLLNSKDISK